MKPAKRERVRVIYRVDKVPATLGGRYETVAFLPDLPATLGRIVCYVHVGQHSEAARHWYTAHTRPARPAEYAALHAELTHIYRDCELRIIKRMPAWSRLPR